MKITIVEKRGDERGASFSLAGLIDEWIQRAADCHLTDIAPGFVRGNHFHTQRREVIVVRYNSEWTLFWDEGPKTKVQSKTIPESGAAVIHVIPGCSHAIANTGNSTLSVMSLSDQPYRWDSQETQRRVIALTDISGRLVDGKSSREAGK